MRTITSGGLTVVAFDEQVYKQEANLITVTHNSTEAAPYKVRLSVSGTTIGTYTLDANKTAVINASDIVRAYGSGQISIVCLNGGETVSFSFSVIGLIAPTSLIIPTNKIGWLIAPPLKMIKDFGFDIYTEAYGYAEDAEFSLDNGNPLPMGRSVKIDSGTKVLHLTEDQTDIAAIQLKPRDCGKKYAAVRWVSATGVTRVHTFEVRGQKSSTQAAISLKTMNGSFATIKGRRDAFSLFLDGLTDYDVWYYSDLCHSSSVEVSFDGVNWRKVDITTDSATIPDGNAGEFYKFEISVNYKQYDAAIM